jgi:hypothetical protein
MAVDGALVRSVPLCFDLVKMQSGTLRLHLRVRRYADTPIRRHPIPHTLSNQERISRLAIVSR